jgi:hypothetical protein
MNHRRCGNLSVVTSSLILAYGMLMPPCAAEAPYQDVWARQLGTNGQDVSEFVALDPTGLPLIGGWTTGDLGGVNAGAQDAFLAKYSASGALAWTTQFGTLGFDFATAGAIDDVGQIYVAGYTTGDDLMPTYEQDYDAFLAKFDPLGQLLWTRQIGVAGFVDKGWAVAVDGAGNILVVGDIRNGCCINDNDVFLRKFNAFGDELWSLQVATSARDASRAIAVDAVGNVYLGGLTEGSLGGPSLGGTDAFLLKFDPAGNQLWARQFGTSAYDAVLAAAVDNDGNILLSGESQGSLGGPNAGSSDAILLKFDPMGNELWSRQAGTTAHESAYGLAVDHLGSAYLEYDGAHTHFLAKYDSAGNDLWSRAIPLSQSGENGSVAVDLGANVYYSATTLDGVTGPTAGHSYDAFLVKYSPVPEPSAIVVVSLACVQLAVAQRGVRGLWKHSTRTGA